MSPANVATPMHKMEKFWVLLGVPPNFSSGGTLLLVQLGLVRVVGRFGATFDELDGAHNNLMMWKNFRGMKDSLGYHSSQFVRPFV